MSSNPPPPAPPGPPPGPGGMNIPIMRPPPGLPQLPGGLPPPNMFMMAPPPGAMMHAPPAAIVGNAHRINNANGVSNINSSQIQINNLQKSGNLPVFVPPRCSELPDDLNQVFCVYWGGIPRCLDNQILHRLMCVCGYGSVKKFVRIEDKPWCFVYFENIRACSVAIDLLPTLFLKDFYARDDQKRAKAGGFFDEYLHGSSNRELGEQGQEESIEESVRKQHIFVKMSASDSELLLKFADLNQKERQEVEREVEFKSSEIERITKLIEINQDVPAAGAELDGDKNQDQEMSSDAISEREEGNISSKGIDVDTLKNEVYLLKQDIKRLHSTVLTADSRRQMVLHCEALMDSHRSKIGLTTLQEIESSHGLERDDETGVVLSIKDADLKEPVTDGKNTSEDPQDSTHIEPHLLQECVAFRARIAREDRDYIERSRVRLSGRVKTLIEERKRDADLQKQKGYDRVHSVVDAPVVNRFVKKSLGQIVKEDGEEENGDNGEGEGKEKEKEIENGSSSVPPPPPPDASVSTEETNAAVATSANSTDQNMPISTDEEVNVNINTAQSEDTGPDTSFTAASTANTKIGLNFKGKGRKGRKSTLSSTFAVDTTEGEEVVAKKKRKLIPIDFDKEQYQHALEDADGDEISGTGGTVGGGNTITLSTGVKVTIKGQGPPKPAPPK